MNPRRAAILVIASTCATSAACSALLGLEPPPAGGSGPEGGNGDVVVAQPEAGDGPGAADAGLCALLDAVADPDAPVFYYPLAALAIDAGNGATTSTWHEVNTAGVNASAVDFAGGAFDGRYVYLAPATNSLVIRIDPATLQIRAFDVATIGSPGGFWGAVFDGQYVYFVPHQANGVNHGIAARYDSTKAIVSAAAWEVFDTSSLALDGGGVAPDGGDGGEDAGDAGRDGGDGGDGGAAADGGPARGFAGGAFDGRYLYFVPADNGAPDGVVARYDTQPAGGSFRDATRWALFDVATANGSATGFRGAVFDGQSLYLVPFKNDVSVNENGYSGLAERFSLAADGGFDKAGSWSPVDMSAVPIANAGDAYGFNGGAFDGRYVYFAPSVRGVVMRFDTTMTWSGGTASWSAYDITRVVPVDGGTPAYAGAAFDGRFVYFVPTGVGFSVLARYDTLSPFDADCAWSTLDLTSINPSATNFFGAVFDGKYVTFIPTGGGWVMRFEPRSVPLSPLPRQPAFPGSFF